MNDEQEQEDLVDEALAQTIIIGDPYKRPRHWSDKPTAAEKRGAPQEIPPAMWERIARYRLHAQTEEHFATVNAIRTIGQLFGFTESELVARGILEEPPAPNPTALKGARR